MIGVATRILGGRGARVDERPFAYVFSALALLVPAEQRSR